MERDGYHEYSRHGLLSVADAHKMKYVLMSHLSYEPATVLEEQLVPEHHAVAEDHVYKLKMSQLKGRSLE